MIHTPYHHRTQIVPILTLHILKSFSRKLKLNKLDGHDIACIVVIMRNCTSHAARRSCPFFFLLFFPGINADRSSAKPGIAYCN